MTVSNLKTKLTEEWQTLLEGSQFVKNILARNFDKELYAKYMIETYHYTLHNARNQALVGVRAFDITPQYLQFCFEHAAEEAGHELMAIHDLKAMGYSVNLKELPAPLPETEQLIAYLYWISGTGNSLQRLGYSFWAETCYEYINPMIRTIKEHLGLTDSQMTFFIAHSSIDQKHAEEVEHMIVKQAKTPEDWQTMERVMIQTLRLTGRMLDAVYSSYRKV